MSKDEKDVVDFEDVDKPHDMDYSAIQKKLSPSEGSSDEDEVDDISDAPIKEKEKETVDFEEFDDEEGADLKYTGDDKEKEVEYKPEKEEKVVEEEEKVEKTAEEKEAEKIKEDVIKYLEETGDTKYIIKGRKFDLKDLSPQEFKDRFSKAGRFNERMQELAGREKTLTEKERLVEQGARQAQTIMDRYQPAATGEKEELPSELQPSEDDTDDVKGLKSIIGNLTKKVSAMENTQKVYTESTGEERLLYELDTGLKEYPLASREEVLAMKAIRPDIPTRDLMEASHEHYKGNDYINAALEANPEFLRELKEKHITEHLATQQKAGRRVARKKSSSTASSKLSTTRTKAPRDFDDIEARLDKMSSADKAALTKEWIGDED